MKNEQRDESPNESHSETRHGDPRDSETRGMAIHESGHAVMAYMLGGAFKTITVVEGDDYLGGVEHSWPGEWFRPDIEIDGRTRNLIQDRVMIGLAGSEAEAYWAARATGTLADIDERIALGAECGQAQRDGSPGRAPDQGSPHPVRRRAVLAVGLPARRHRPDQGDDAVAAGPYPAPGRGERRLDRTSETVAGPAAGQRRTVQAVGVGVNPGSAGAVTIWVRRPWNDTLGAEYRTVARGRPAGPGSARPGGGSRRRLRRSPPRPSRASAASARPACPGDAWPGAARPVGMAGPVAKGDGQPLDGR
jgi:hypothetical protein